MLETIGRYLSCSSQENIRLDDCKASDTNDTGNLQATGRKIRIFFTNYLVEIGDVVPHLGRDHAHEPVAMIAGQLAQQERGAKFSFL